MFNKICKIIFISILTAVLFGLNSSFAETKEKVKLKIWRIPSKDIRGASMRADRLIYERFLELNPDIEPEAASGIKLIGQLDFDAVTMSLAAGTAPDVIYSNLSKSTTFIQEGFFLPLEKYIEGKKEIKANIHEKLWQVIKQAGPPDNKEHVYLLPYGTPLIMALYYRKDVFREAGLDPRKPPKNWEEFIEFAKKITNPAKGKYGWMTYNGENASWLFANFIYQAGGDILKKDETGVWRAVYNSKQGEEALKFYHRLFQEKFIKNGKELKGVVCNISNDNDWSIRWNNGDVGMCFNYLDKQTLIPPGTNPDLIGVAPLPSGPTGLGGGEFNQTMLGINAQVKDPKVIDAALRYIEYMAGNEPARIRTEILVEEGMGKLVHPAYLRMFGYSSLLDEVDPNWVKINDKAFTYAHPEPYGKNCDRIYIELAGVMDKASIYEKMDYKKELDDAARSTNEKLLDLLPKETLDHRKKIVVILLIAAAIFFIFYSIRSLRIFKDLSRTNSGVAGRLPLKIHIYAWLFMGIAVITTLVWGYYPVLRGLVMAFQNYKIMGNSTYIGLDNFVKILWEEQFWRSMWVTLQYVFLTLTIGFAAPIILALMLHEIKRGSLFFRVVYYLPAVTTGVMVLLLWKILYEPADSGFLNSILIYLHLPALKWLQDPKIAMLCVVIPGIWAGVGAGSIFYLAALKNVPDELYEAAAIDGAGIFKKLRHVTYPTLRIIIVINFVGAFIGSFYATERILVMTGGGPANATRVIGLEIFYDAFVYLKFGYATAIAWILGSILVGFTMFQMRMMKDVRFTASKM